MLIPVPKRNGMGRGSALQGQFDWITCRVTDRNQPALRTKQTQPFPAVLAACSLELWLFCLIDCAPKALTAVNIRLVTSRTTNTSLDNSVKLLTEETFKNLKKKETLRNFQSVVKSQRNQPIRGGKPQSDVTQ